jgi:hypothetical protein
MSAKQLPDLSGFTGSSEFTRFKVFNKRALATEGAIFLAEQVGAFWLLDEIALGQRGKVAGEEFQVWKLTVKDSKARLAVEDGNDNVVRAKRIPFTDFPAPGITLWAARNELGGVTIMLPSEY